jgi:hypothetical protein
VSSFCRHRVALPAVAGALAFALTCAAAPAALDMTIGARKLVTNEPLSACNSRAGSALRSVLGSAAEVEDTGEWKGNGPPGAQIGSAAAAAIHCYPIGSGYVVTFTCAAQLPENPDTAIAMCTKLAAAFDAATTAAL